VAYVDNVRGADLELMTAAPDLLAFARTVVKTLDKHDAAPDDHICADCLLVAEALSVIAKAEGRES